MAARRAANCYTPLTFTFYFYSEQTGLAEHAAGDSVTNEPSHSTKREKYSNMLGA